MQFFQHGEVAECLIATNFQQRRCIQCIGLDIRCHLQGDRGQLAGMNGLPLAAFIWEKNEWISGYYLRQAADVGVLIGSSLAIDHCWPDNG